MAKQDPPYLFIGARGRVLALEKHTGREVWRIELKTGFFRTGKDFVTLSEGVDHLFAFSYGIAFCIDKGNGRILWQTEIKELKQHVASLAVDATLLGSAGADSGGSDTAELDGDGQGGDGGGSSDDGGDGGGD